MRKESDDKDPVVSLIIVNAAKKQKTMYTRALSFMGGCLIIVLNWRKNLS